MKFGRKVLNWTLNDFRKFYLKQTLDGEIIPFFHGGPVFSPPCIQGKPKNGPPKKILNNFITLKHFSKILPAYTASNSTPFCKSLF